MNATWSPDLARLLGDYERLTRDETAALRSRDFAALSRIHELKPGLLRKIIEVGANCDFNRRDPSFQHRLQALAELESEHAECASNALRESRVERDNLAASRHRLRGLGHAYRAGEDRAARLSAQG